MSPRVILGSVVGERQGYRSVDPLLVAVGQLLVRVLRLVVCPRAAFSAITAASSVCTKAMAVADAACVCM